MKNHVIILAAGKGSRMGGDMPKALTLLGGKPMIEHVVSAVELAGVKPIVVVGYKGEKIQEYLGDRAVYITQKEQKGTGHAVLQVEPYIEEKKGTRTLILYADQPFVTTSSISSFLHEATDTELSMATALVSDKTLFESQFSGFGRILRGRDGEVVAIREAKDASPAELMIREVNPAIFCVDTHWLFSILHKVGSDNAQGEVYLTDIVSMVNDIHTVAISSKEALGANTKEQLLYLESLL